MPIESSRRASEFFPACVNDELEWISLFLVVSALFFNCRIENHAQQQQQPVSRRGFDTIRNWVCLFVPVCARVYTQFDIGATFNPDFVKACYCDLASAAEAAAREFNRCGLAIRLR